MGSPQYPPHMLDRPPSSPTLPHTCVCSTAPRSTNGLDCHHGINVSASQDVLMANITHGMTCFHDLTVFNFTVCACVEGRGGGGERGMPPLGNGMVCFQDLTVFRVSQSWGEGEAARGPEGGGQ